MEQGGVWNVEFALPNAEVPLTLFRSSRSGLRVLFGKVEGPMLNVFTTFRTEAHDSRGIPHSLEHLVFLGSKNLPFKGILDEVSTL